MILAFLLAIFSFWSSSEAFTALNGIKVTSVSSDEDDVVVDLGNFLSDSSTKTMLVLGTYAADFNAIEYAQRLKFYLPELKECGLGKFGLVLNCEKDAAIALADAVDLPMDDDQLQIFVDPLGDTGRAYNVGRGWRPDDEDMSPYLKLFGMLWGLGAWATLPAVIGGYIGNPFKPQRWIEDALAVGQKKGRWPNTALELDNDGEIIVNKFTELPYVGQWPRRPLELATLRLQNMMDISIKSWSDLAPNEGALESGVLTQLGGCMVLDSDGEMLFEWRDPGICAVANFEDIIKKLK